MKFSIIRALPIRPPIAQRPRFKPVSALAWLVLLGVWTTPLLHADLAVSQPKPKRSVTNLPLTIVTKKGQQIAKLEIPRKLLGKIEAPSAGKGKGSGVPVFPIHPIAGGLALAMALSWGMFWLLRRNRRTSTPRGWRFATAGLAPLLAILIGVQALADETVPLQPKPKLLQLQIDGLTLKGSVVVTVVDKGNALRLIVSPEHLKELLKKSVQNSKK